MTTNVGPETGARASVDRRTIIGGGGALAVAAVIGYSRLSAAGRAASTPSVTVVPGVAPTSSLKAAQSTASKSLGAVNAAAVTKPITTFGVNCYDLYNQTFSTTRPADPLARLRVLKDAGFSLVRFSASPFWASNWKTFDADRARHLAFLDRVFSAAEQLGVRLVPTAIWAPFAVSDYCNEPYSAWGISSSATRRYADAYVALLSKRYAKSKAILAWEFSNEMNSYADLPNGNLFFPPISAAGGTPSKRTPADRISGLAVQSAIASFAKTVRANMPGATISSGSDVPRYNQMNLARGLWSADTSAMIGQAMGQTLAGSSSLLSVHLYPTSMKDRGKTPASTYSDILAIARATADSCGAKLFVGEFGVAKSGNVAADKAEFAKLIKAIVANRVDYAALWNYDWTYQPQWNVQVNNDRSWMLDAMRNAAAGAPLWPGYVG